MNKTTTPTTKKSSQSTLWTVDPLDTTVGFSIRHFMVANVRGVFESVQGTVEYDPRRPEDAVVEPDRHPRSLRQHP